MSKEDETKPTDELNAVNNKVNYKTLLDDDRKIIATAVRYVIQNIETGKFADHKIDEKYGELIDAMFFNTQDEAKNNSYNNERVVKVIETVTII